MNDLKIISECIDLERELSRYKLWGNLVPQQSFGVNLRDVFNDTEWDRLRRIVYKKYGYQCVICDHDGRMEAHELWTYDYAKSLQRLHAIVALCKYCHLHQHLGYAKILLNEGKLDANAFYRHWFTMNGIAPNTTTFLNYERKAFKLHYLRNYFDWIVVYGDGMKIESGITVDDVLKHVLKIQ